MKLHYSYTTHMPVLMKLVNMTEGPILELGGGMFSTPLLHWMCREKKRKLVSYDSSEQYFGFMKRFENDYHKVHLVKDWAGIGLDEDWSVVFIDQSGGASRARSARELANNADYVLLHDTDEAHDYYYQYSKIYKHYKYRWDTKGIYPRSTVLSNFKDLSDL